MLAQEPLAPIDTPDAPGFIQCTLPVNAGPMHYVFNTAIREMDEWMRSSETPPAAPRLDLNDDGGDSFCRLFGTTALFSAEQMASLYVDEAGYAEAVKEATDVAVSAGFILSDDAQDIKDWAPEQWRSQLMP